MVQKIIVTVVFVGLMSTVFLYYSQGATPISSLYNIKRLKENAELLLKSTPEEKAEYYSRLLGIRLKELELITPNTKEHQLILPAALRYSTTAGEYTRVIKENNLKAYAYKARNQFKEHTKVLKRLIASYPRENTDDQGSQFIIDDINYLIIYEKELPR